MHSKWSGDSKADLFAMCKAAVSKGLKKICITEHLDFEPTDISYQALDYDCCLKEVEKARKALGDIIDIRFGVETDYQLRFKPKIVDFLKSHELDYVIGSAHYIDGILLENHEKYFPFHDEKTAYCSYFNNVLEAVESGLFDTLAHMDLCKRYGVLYYGPFEWKKYEEKIVEILKAVINKNMTLEINTSGLRQAPKDTYPTRKILELYKTLGGSKIIVGSDAHRESDVGSDIQAALKMACQTGFEDIDTYKCRKCEKTKIISLLI